MKYTVENPLNRDRLLSGLFDTRLEAEQYALLLAKNYMNQVFESYSDMEQLKFIKVVEIFPEES